MTLPHRQVGIVFRAVCLYNIIVYALLFGVCAQREVRTCNFVVAAALQWEAGPCSLGWVHVWQAGEG